MSKPIVPIGDIIKLVFTEIEKGKVLTREDVENKWFEIVGDQAKQHTKPASLRKGVLTVLVDSSTWMHRMALEKRKVLKQLKSNFGKDKISGINFKIGEF